MYGGGAFLISLPPFFLTSAATFSANTSLICFRIGIASSLERIRLTLYSPSTENVVTGYDNQGYCAMPLGVVNVIGC